MNNGSHLEARLRRWLGGIEFSMSLFVADRASADPGEALPLKATKLGILGASLSAGGGGWLVLRRAPLGG